MALKYNIGSEQQRRLKQAAGMGTEGLRTAFNRGGKLGEQERFEGTQTLEKWSRNLT